MMSPVEASSAVATTTNQTQAAQLDQVTQLNPAQTVSTYVSHVEDATVTCLLYTSAASNG